MLARGVACGIERVLPLSLLDPGRFEAEDLPRELSDWALSFPSPALAGLPWSAPSGVDSPPNEWEPARARKGSERSRLLRAAAEIVASAGHSRLTAASIARRAEVREEIVLELYPTIDDCLLDALELVGLEALVSIAKASRGAEDGPSGVCRALSALMERLAGDPTLRSVAFLEVLAPGSAGMDRRERLLCCMAELIAKPVHPLGRRRVTAEATAGALWGLVHHHVASRSAHALPGFAPQAAYIVLAPLLGAPAAVEAITAEWPERPARTSFR
jgi:AcrR family transcriptional regulator